MRKTILTNLVLCLSAVLLHAEAATTAASGVKAGAEVPHANATVASVKAGVKATTAVTKSAENASNRTSNRTSDQKQVDVEALLQEARRVNLQNLSEAEILEIMEAYGWIISQQSGITMLDLTEAESAAVFEGLKAGLSGKRPDKLQETGPLVGPYMQARMKEVQQALAAQQDAQAADFFSGLEANQDVQKTDSGLYYEILEPGSADRASESDVVTVHYTGRFLSGEIFDSSVQKGVPAQFPLAQVIPGFREGLQLIGKGGKAVLYVPGNLGYGPQGAPNIPPNATLVFEVELLDFQDGSSVPQVQVSPASPTEGDSANGSN